MRQLEFAVCETDSGAAAELQRSIKGILPYAKTIIYQNAEEFLRDVRKRKYCFRAVFMEICTTEWDGIELARSLRRLDETVPLIFTTNTEQYYREAFEVFAFQYLLKPVSSIKIKKILDRLKLTEKSQDENTLHFRYRSQIHTLTFNEISYISSSLHTVNFHLANGESLHCRGKLSDFEDQLKDSSILRCHQSFYVNLDATVGMRSDSFILKDMEIPISRSYAKEAQSRYQAYLKEK